MQVETKRKSVCSITVPKFFFNARTVDAACWEDAEESAARSSILHADLLHGTSLTYVGRSAATADVFAQLINIAVNALFNRFISSRPRCVTQGKHASKTDLTSLSEAEWHGDALPGMSVQAVGTEAEKQGKVAVNGLLEPLSAGEQEPSPLSYAEVSPAANFELYRYRMGSNGTSASSPRGAAYRKSSYAPESPKLA